MILILHIAAALGSLLAAFMAYARPTSAKLNATYILTAVMFTSGTYLVIRNSSHLLEACVMGLSLLSVVAWAIAGANHKLKLAEQIRHIDR